MARRLDRLLWIGPVAFFLAACAWSVLDVEFAADTWIGLAAGRHIMEHLDWGRFRETFPRLDPFSYTFYGQPWFNQNWLSNLGYYRIYDRLGPAAVVYCTWAMVACADAIVLLASYWRTESWLAAWLAAALAGIGMRDFLEPRAATVGLLCAVLLWALVCAIEGQRERRRWWPILPLLPLLWVWANAHGGFVFGYGLLALYCGCWIAARLFRRFQLAASGSQILAIALVVVAAFSLTILAGPFGIERFTHVGQVASDTPFRTVSEFLPAYIHVGDSYPPMWRFWWIVASTGSAVMVLWLAGMSAARSGSSRNTPSRVLPPWSLFDAALVLACLAMTLWGRRFAPLLYVVAAPVLAVWIMRLIAPLSPYLRGHGVPALKVAAAAAAVATALLTWTAAQRGLVEPYGDQPATGLLDRARGNREATEAALFLGRNHVHVNVLANYGDAALVMFYAPLARVFIDPRGDQVYSVRHLRHYFAVMDTRASPGELQDILDGSETDAVLVRRVARAATLRNMLLRSPEWALVFLNANYTLFLRVGSPALVQLGELTRTGRAWEPMDGGTVTPDAQASRAMVLLNTAPPELAPALEQLEKAVERKVLLGLTFYPVIARLVARTAGRAGAAEYIERQAARVNSDSGLALRDRSALLAVLAESRKGLERTDDGWAELPDNLPSGSARP